MVPTLMFIHSETIREPAAEMLGTMILALVGTGANCQAVLSTNTGVVATPRGDWVSVSLGWACGPPIVKSYGMFY